MSLKERSNLVLALVRVLFVNGQSTDQILAAAGRFGQTLGATAGSATWWRHINLDGRGRSHRCSHESRGFGHALAVYRQALAQNDGHEDSALRCGRPFRQRMQAGFSPQEP